MSNAEIIFIGVVVVLTLLIVAVLISPDARNTFKLFKDEDEN